MNAFRWEELRVGQAASFDASVTSAMMKRFLDDTGDCNPLHVDAGFARGRGYPDTVVYGLLTASFYSTLVGVHLPGRYALLHGLNVDFQKPVHVGMPLRVAGEIAHLSDAYRRIEIAASIHSGGDLMSKAKLRVGLSE